MSLQIQTLKKLQKENIFVDIFTDLFKVSFYGFIRKLNNEFILLEHYNDDDGTYNGIVVLRHVDVTRIKWDNNDINGVSRLISDHDEEEKILSINIDSIEDVLKSINKVYKHISISIQNIDDDRLIIGEMEKMDKNTIIIKEYGTRSTLDRGMIMLGIKDITRVDAGGIYENGLLKIHKKK